MVVTRRIQFIDGRGSRRRGWLAGSSPWLAGSSPWPAGPSPWPGPSQSHQPDPAASPRPGPGPPPTADRRTRPGLIRYRGFFFGATGYHTEAWAVVRHLHRLGYSLRILPVGERSDLSRVPDPRLRELLKALLAPLPGERLAVEVQHVPPGFFRPSPDARALVGRTMVETDGLPAGWAEACRRLDETWVPSSFCAAVFTAAGLDPGRVRVVPIGVDTNTFRPRPGARLPPGVRARPFKFLSVLTWQERKGWDLLVRAYLEEFGPREEVTLILKTQPLLGGAEEARRRLCRFIGEELGLAVSDIPPIVLIQALMSEAEMAALYAACDAFVLPSRGEGLGRPYLEAMATGLPTIGTGWGGNLDFMRPDNSYLIEVEELVPAGASDRPDPYRGLRWARPSLAHLRRLMRAVYSDPEAARERGGRARADVVAAWDVAVTGDRLAAELGRFLG